MRRRGEGGEVQEREGAPRPGSSHGALSLPAVETLEKHQSGWDERARFPVWHGRLGSPRVRGHGREAEVGKEGRERGGAGGGEVRERGRKGEGSRRIRKRAHAMVTKSKSGEGGKRKEKSTKHDLFASSHFSHPCHRMYPDASTSAPSVPVADRYRILPTVALVLFNIFTRPPDAADVPPPRPRFTPGSCLLLEGPPGLIESWWKPRLPRGSQEASSGPALPRILPRAPEVPQAGAPTQGSGGGSQELCLARTSGRRGFLGSWRVGPPAPVALITWLATTHPSIRRRCRCPDP